jgi:hypothetical protein
MKLPLYLLLFSLLFLSAFQTKQGVKLSFKNNTPYHFKELMVNIRGAKYTFTDLKAGQSTRPIKVTGTYRYCYAKAITATDTLICQPTDFVGEKLYTSGKLQMKLQLYPGNEGRKYMLIN